MTSSKKKRSATEDELEQTHRTDQALRSSLETQDDSTLGGSRPGTLPTPPVLAKHTTSSKNSLARRDSRNSSSNQTTMSTVSSGDSATGSGGASASGTTSSRSIGASIAISKQTSDKSMRTKNSSASFAESSGDAVCSFSKRTSDITMEASSRLRDFHRETLMTKNKTVESMTLNKLRFDRLGLRGRDEEVATLNGCLDRLLLVAERENKSAAKSKCKEEKQSERAPLLDEEDNENKADRGDAKSRSQREMVFISGLSGCGKTALAQTLASRACKLKGVFLSGKYDFYLRDEPYSGIVGALQELCGKMLTMKSEAEGRIKYDKINKELLDTLGDEVLLIMGAFPILGEILDLPASSLVTGTNAATADQQCQDYGKESLVFAFRKFMRVISSHFAPLVICLDDLQWADAGSFELLEAIITDGEIRQLMIIGCYRSNEVNATHYLSKVSRDLHDKKERSGFEITEMYLENLDTASVNQVVMALLSIDDEDRTMPLAEVCHRRTLGNAFHLLAFLSMLEGEKMLEFNLGTFSWSWCMEAIEADTAAAENVVQLVQEKINKQPKMMRHLLQMASCLGSTFDEKMLVLVWNDFSTMRRSWQEVEMEASSSGEIHALLTQAVENSFIERIHETSTYRWVHDKIKEAAISLAPEDKMADYQYAIGEVLLTKLNPAELKASTFVVANLLNSKVITDAGKREAIAQLNLDAAEKSKALSCFDTALKYAQQGIEQLSYYKWQQQTELALKLYAICAEAQSGLGNTKEMQIYCNEIMRQDHIPLLDKLVAHNLTIKHLGTSGQGEKALKLGLSILDQLGCKFPRGSVSKAVKAMSWLKKTKPIARDEIDNLMPMTDPTKSACMQLMITAATNAHYCSDVFAFICIISRMVRWTEKHGLNENAPGAFALFGFIKILTGDLIKGNNFGEEALLLLNKLENKKMHESRVSYLVWFMVAPWAQPIQSSLKHLMPGYKIGMEVGDTESSMWNASMYILLCYLSGTNLASLEVDCRTYLAQMRELEQHDIYLCTIPFFQGMLNLRHGAENPVELSGEAIEDEGAHIATVKSETIPRNYWHVLIFKSFMCSYFADEELGAILALERGDVYLKKNGCPFSIADAFHRSLALYAMARKTRKGPYAKEAKRLNKMMKTWIKKGCPNVGHCTVFLDAEDAWLRGKKYEASGLYSKTIGLALRTGFKQDAALANERFGELLLEMDDKERAILQFKDAIKFYSDWGAVYKANLLHEKRSQLWSSEGPMEMEMEIVINDDDSELSMEDETGY